MADLETAAIVEGARVAESGWEWFGAELDAPLALRPMTKSMRYTYTLWPSPNREQVT